ncbi:ABC transporter substrate-binding protein [Lachnospiraceae bacterium 54-53]
MKKNLRTAFTLILTGTALLLTGCQSGNTSPETSKEAASASDQTYRVGIIQLIDNGAFTDMREGFIQELKDKGYGDDRLTIDYKNAQGDATNLNSICQEMADSGVDLIAAIATPAAQAIVNMETDIPVVFISVSNPVGAGIITEMEKPDKNATGTSNAIPVNEIFDLAEKLTPECKTFGFLYNTGEVNSVTTVDNAKEYLTSIGLSYEEAVVANSSEVQQAAQSLVGKVDAIFVPNDSVIQSAMPLVSEVARDAKLPVYASSATTVSSGAFATIAISDKEIGKISAGMAVKCLEGTPISEIPAVVVPASSTVINQDAADALGITFSDEINASAAFVQDAE